MDLTSVKLSGEITADMYNTIVDVINMSPIEAKGLKAKIPSLITAALDMCTYLTTIALDKKAIANYYRTSKDGIATVERIKEGLKKAYGGDTEAFNAEIKKYASDSTSSDSFLSFISDALGYEGVEELMRDTAMKLSQQVVFCASGFNPMESTRIISRAVMAALGLSDAVGDTSAATVSDLYDRLNMTA